MRNKYSVFSLIKNALSYHENWQRAWKDPTPKKEYDAVIVGGGGHAQPNSTKINKNVNSFFNYLPTPNATCFVPTYWYAPLLYAGAVHLAFLLISTCALDSPHSRHVRYPYSALFGLNGS